MGVKGESFNLEHVASSSDGKEIPAPERPQIDENTPKSVIRYKDRIFEVPAPMVHYLADLPENLPSRIRRAIENGMGFMYADGAFACWYCNHYRANLATIMESEVQRLNETGDNPRPIAVSQAGTPGVSVSGCFYMGDENVRFARPYTNPRTGAVVIAQGKPCVVYDTMIADLVERGLLDEYEVKGKKFNYPTLDELKENPRLEKAYTIRPTNLIKRAIIIMKGILGISKDD